MQEIFSFFYKRYGLRRIQSLLSPRPFDLKQFPKNSTFHLADFNSDNNDVDISKPYLNSYSKKILIDFPDELIDEKGKPIKKAVLVRTIAKPFLMKNNKYFRYMKDPHTFKDELTLIMYNYNYLNEKYKYVEMPMTEYYKWWNTQKTIWHNVNKIATETNRNQFYIVDIDAELPSYSLLKIYSERVNLTMTKIFNNPDKLMLLEIWKWFNPATRINSVFSELTSDNFSKVNFLFQYNNKFSLINLGYLNSWIKGNENTTDISSVVQLDYKQVEKIFLKFLMTLTSESIIEPLINEEPNEPIVKDKEDEQEELEIKEETDDYYSEHEGEEASDEIYDDADLTSDLHKQKLNDKNVITSVTDKELDNALHEDKSLSNYLDEIDNNLKVLDQVNKKKLKEQGIKITDKGEEILTENIETEDDITDEELTDIIYKSKTSNELLNEQINEYVDFGLLSAADYRKAKLEIEKFKELKDPYGSNQKILDKIKITKEDIQLDPSKTKMKDIDLVSDKSMLDSSLMSFDNDYINKVMQKDILSMVSNIQNSGIIIKNYEIEEDNSVLGDYEHHRLELKPLDGASSTIHFRIPKIKNDGTFVSSSNKYVMRKQRTD